MKFRILEHNHECFEIQMRGRFWFWRSSWKYGDFLNCDVGPRRTSTEFYCVYKTYDDAKKNYDRLLEYHKLYIKRKKARKRVHDFIDFNDKGELFLENL